MGWDGMGWREGGENVISWRWGGGLDTLLVLRTYIQFAYGTLQHY